MANAVLLSQLRLQSETGLRTPPLLRTDSWVPAERPFILSPVKLTRLIHIPGLIVKTVFQLTRPEGIVGGFKFLQFSCNISWLSVP